MTEEEVSLLSSEFEVQREPGRIDYRTFLERLRRAKGAGKVIAASLTASQVQLVKYQAERLTSRELEGKLALELRFDSGGRAQRSGSGKERLSVPGPELRTACKAVGHELAAKDLAGLLGALQATSKEEYLVSELLELLFGETVGA